MWFQPRRTLAAPLSARLKCRSLSIICLLFFFPLLYAVICSCQRWKHALVFSDEATRKMANMSFTEREMPQKLNIVCACLCFPDVISDIWARFSVFVFLFNDGLRASGLHGLFPAFEVASKDRLCVFVSLGCG